MVGKVAKWVGLIIFFGAIFCAITWPLCLKMDTHFIVKDPLRTDSHQYVWNLFAFKELIATKSNLLHTDLQFYPIGANLLMHGYTPIVNIWALAFDNNFLALNLFIALNFILSGLGFYLLARRYIPNCVIALAVAFGCTFMPYKLSHLAEHFTLVLTATMPFYLMAFTDAFQGNANGKLASRISVLSHQKVFITILLLLLTVFTDYYTAYFLIGFSVLYCLYYYIGIYAFSIKKIQHVLIAAAVLLLGHFAVSGLRAIGVDDRGGFWWGADAVQYCLPPAKFPSP